MILTITASDFRKLSDACQRELLGLLGYQQGDDDESIPYEENFVRLDDGDNYSSLVDTQDASAGSKRVIDITPDQARDLLANISEKSIETLKCFASGEAISLDDLIGENRPYSSLSDLKRSFVGAVNRRLRTVTGNRQAVLFLTTKSDSQQTGTKISVRKIAAMSLSQALGLPIPDPTETQ